MSSPTTERGFHRRLAAVMFADVVEYTRLASEDEDAALRLLETFHGMAGETAERHGGRVVKRIGDAVMADFPSTQTAVTAALMLVEGFGRDVRPARDLRIGVHLGEVMIAADGDLYGDGVNVASRLHSAASPGQVVVSEDVARQLRHRREFRLESLGSRDLKGIAEPVAVFAVGRAEQVLHDPASPGSSRPATPPRSIAVLPFTNMSPDPDNEFFSDGITEEILTVLAKIEDLKVISRTSAMQYKGTAKSLKRIGEELGVATVLEGSVRRARDRVRITAQLIDARTDDHLWAERYDHDLEDIFEIQTDVAERIAEALKLRLTPRERSRLAERPSTSQEAYECYLRGLWFWNRRTPEDLVKAIAHFEEAIAADPGFPPAFAGIGMALIQSAWWDPAPGEEVDRARAAVRTALGLDPGLGEAHAALAQIHLYDLNWEGAGKEFQRALELIPGDASVRHLYAFYLAAMGRFAEAFAMIESARELDPLSLLVLQGDGEIQLLARHYDSAERRLRQALELDPTFGLARYTLAMTYHLTGSYPEALAQWKRLGLITEEDVQHALEALPRGPMAYLERVLEMGPEKGAPPALLASIYARVGRRDEAFALLEQALEVRDWFVITLAVNPLFDSIRDDPRYRALVERLGLDRVSPAPAG